MSKTRICRRCGGTIIEPAYEGDGVYEPGTCDCDTPDKLTALAAREPTQEGTKNA